MYGDIAGRRCERRTFQLHAERQLGLEIVVHEHDEGVIAGLVELQVVERQDLVRCDRMPDLTVRHDIALDLENRVAVRVVQPDLDVVRPVALRRMCFEPQNEMHLRVYRRDLIDADPVENAEDVELAFGRDIGVIRQQSELDLHRRNILRRRGLVNELHPEGGVADAARVALAQDGLDDACAGPAARDFMLLIYVQEV